MLKWRQNLQFIKMVPQGRIELPTPGFSVLCSTNWATEAHFKWRFRRDSNPRSPVWQTDMLTNYTTEPLLVAGEGFEPTTSGLWARRATRLLYPAIWRRKRDSNPRGTFIPCRFSRPIPSTGLGLEPATNRLWAGGSNQLSYGSKYW